MIESSLHQPVVDLRQVFNFRDLGGLPAGDREVRTGILYRSDGLDRLHADDGEVLEPLGITTIIDLRTDKEVEDRGHAPVEITGADVHHLPLMTAIWPVDDEGARGEAAAYLARKYLEMLDDRPESLVASLQLIADADRHAVVFHCAAGKDRTGVLAAVVLGLLGVPDELIVADYVRTSVASARWEEWARENDPEFDRFVREHPPAWRTCPPEAMERFLTGVRERWGSIDDLVVDIGLSRSAVADLRVELLV